MWANVHILTMFWTSSGALESFLEHLPDSPLFLYDVALPMEALPRFYLVLYLEVIEPVDVQEHVQKINEIKKW